MTSRNPPANFQSHALDIPILCAWLGDHADQRHMIISNRRRKLLRRADVITASLHGDTRQRLHVA